MTDTLIELLNLRNTEIQNIRPYTRSRLTRFVEHLGFKGCEVYLDRGVLRESDYQDFDLVVRHQSADPKDYAAALDEAIAAFWDTELEKERQGESDGQPSDGPYSPGSSSLKITREYFEGHSGPFGALERWEVECRGLPVRIYLIAPGERENPANEPDLLRWI